MENKGETTFLLYINHSFLWRKLATILTCEIKKTGDYFLLIHTNLQQAIKLADFKLFCTNMVSMRHTIMYILDQPQRTYVILRKSV